MRTKEDIQKIKGSTGQQLDFVASVTTADKIHKKRLSIFIFLFFTAGLSLLFLTYREIKNHRLALNLPQINFHLSNIVPTPDPLTSILSTDSNTWKICLFDLNTSRLIYNHNCSLSSPPTLLPTSTSVILKDTLPNGLDIKESLIQNKSSIDFSATITSPVQHWLLITNVFGSSSLSDSQKLLPTVAETLYWHFSVP